MVQDNNFENKEVRKSTSYLNAAPPLALSCMHILYLARPLVNVIDNQIKETEPLGS